MKALLVLYLLLGQVTEDIDGMSGGTEEGSDKPSEDTNNTVFTNIERQRNGDIVVTTTVNDDTKIQWCSSDRNNKDYTCIGN